MSVQCVERESYFDACNDWERFRRFVAFGINQSVVRLRIIAWLKVKLSLCSTN
jgi:hypothetical protein